MSWIQTHSGIPFDVLDPDPEAVYIEDIATALSRLCRFGGHTDRFYSVAEHCLLVSHAVEEYGCALEGLMHDAAEAYIGDLVRPVKQCLPAFEEFEAGLQRAVARRFGLAPNYCDLTRVKEADLRMLATERQHLLEPCERRWESLEGVRPYTWLQPACMTPDEARQSFLSRFTELHGGAI